MLTVTASWLVSPCQRTLISTTGLNQAVEVLRSCGAQLCALGADGDILAELGLPHLSPAEVGIKMILRSSHCRSDSHACPAGQHSRPGQGAGIKWISLWGFCPLPGALRKRQEEQPAPDSPFPGQHCAPASSQED